MADSISGWMASSLVEACCVRRDAGEQLDDMPYVSGGKVQIRRCLGSEEGSACVTADTAQMDVELGIVRKPALWAVVGDRANDVLVRFSPECVTWFDNCHSRELTSLSRAVISLLSFRPSLSAIGPKLLSGQSGPFARVEAPRLYLDVKALHIWGSPSNVVYWMDTQDLQDALSMTVAGESPQLARRFRRWLIHARRQMAGGCQRGAREKSAGRVDLSPRHTAATPPPFQEARLGTKRKRVRLSPEPNEPEALMASMSGMSPSSLQGVGVDIWGSFLLANEADNLFDTEMESMAKGRLDAEAGNSALDVFDSGFFDDPHIGAELDVAANEGSLRTHNIDATHDAMGALPESADDVVMPTSRDASRPPEEHKGAATIASSGAPPSRVSTRAKIARRITTEERERAKREYDLLLAQMHGKDQ